MRLPSLATLLVTSAAVAAPPDGTIVKTEPCVADAVVSYEAYLDAAKRSDAEEAEAARNEGHTFVASPATYLTREQFAARREEAAAIDCQRLRYASDGLEVVAFLWKPKQPSSTKLPLIVFNRGGNREFAKLTPTHGFRRLALDGFVVLASQYRGVDGGEGKEEFGGAEVDDVKNLLPVAVSLGYVDMNNVFLLGWSRGGMETALALKQGMKVNAAAIGGALTDLVAERARRPQLAQSRVEPAHPRLRGTLGCAAARTLRGELAGADQDAAPAAPRRRRLAVRSCRHARFRPGPPARRRAVSARDLRRRRPRHSHQQGRQQPADRGVVSGAHAVGTATSALGASTP